LCLHTLLFLIPSSHILPLLFSIFLLSSFLNLLVCTTTFLILTNLIILNS
jgi:hypothetical protein